jgi:hypothetical protein
MLPLMFYQQIILANKVRLANFYTQFVDMLDLHCQVDMFMITLTIVAMNT